MFWMAVQVMIRSMVEQVMTLFLVVTATIVYMAAPTILILSK